MKRHFSLKSLLLNLAIVLIASNVIIWTFLLVMKPSTHEQAEAAQIKSVSSQIQADGEVTAQDQATLHFQTGGKLVSLPFKEGDSVRAGQTIAALDSTVLQKQLTQALNTYRSTRDAFDQSSQNQENGVTQNQQKTTTGQSGTDYLNGVAQRLVDESQAGLDNSVLNVEIAQQALQLSTLTSPLSGIITHEDATTAGVNVLPTTTFTVADPTTLVFRVNVSENDIDYVSEGNSATIKLSGGRVTQLIGTVDKIYPDKVTLASGQKVYQVDLSSPDFPDAGKLGQSGTALITSSLQGASRLVPTWTVLDHDSVWVLHGNQPILRKVTVGKVHGSLIEVLSGLQDGDEVITNPESIAASKYQLL